MNIRFGLRTLACLTLWAGLTSVGVAAPTVDQILQFKPRQKGVDVSVPSGSELSACTVELEKGKPANGKQPTAWVLKDGQGRVLRKFHDLGGTGRVDQWSYFRDGDEAYREIDTDGDSKADTYRWLGANGSKWGVDVDGDGSIDTWKAISPEEVSQEILGAVATRDFKKLQALMLNKDDIQLLGLPESEIARIQAKLDKAGQQFQTTCAGLINLSEKTTWVHLETKLPQTVPADVLGSKQDLVRYPHAAILYQEGDNKHNWLQTGELIQVGRAWRVVQAPIAGSDIPAGPAETAATAGQFKIPAGAEALIEKLKDLDKNPPKTVQETVAYNMKRAAILEQIAALLKADDKMGKEVWIRQIAECYASAAQNGDKSALERLGQWQAALVKDQAGSPLTAYVVFRVMACDYAQQLQSLQTSAKTKPEEMTKLQDAWKEKLSKFVSDYPQSDDTPDALMQLGMVNEFVGKESDAKNWYGLLTKNFPKHTLARKAQGCLDRLGLEGKTMELAGPTLGAGETFSIASLKGKAVVVYYWASWNASAASDFAKVKVALAGFAGKVEIVCVNLDNAPGDAVNFIKTNSVPGTHLFQPGGLDSPLATRYGITVLPNMFLLGPDGTVVSRNVQANTLDDELKKIFKDAK
jgi:DNA-binding FrmR family transcriptional regulator